MSFVQSTDEIKEILSSLRNAREFIKQCLEQEEALKQKLYNIINENDGIIDLETGETLATWKYSTDSESFDRRAFKEKYPDIYREFTAIKPGPRTLRLAK